MNRLTQIMTLVAIVSSLVIPTEVFSKSYCVAGGKPINEKTAKAAVALNPACIGGCNYNEDKSCKSGWRYEF